MEWTEIKSSEDAEDLLNKFGGFHDGCIKEIKYISGEYVGENLSMMPFNGLRRLSVIFQRQWKDPRAIEMIFEGLKRMNLAPSVPDNDGIIYGAYFNVINDIVYWADWEGFDISQIDSNPLYRECTWIISEKAKWRAADEYIGAEEIYISKK